MSYPSNHSIHIPIQKIRPNALIPSYATDLSAGVDLHSCLSVHLKPMERLLIPTGIAIAIPVGFEGQVRPRSGLAAKSGITIVNAPGTIDSDYRKEIFVALINLSSEEFFITEGMRIAQLLVAPVFKIQWNICDCIESTDRGGFGSTGLY